MTDQLIKLLWMFLAGAFAMGGWSSTLEWRTQHHSKMIEKHDQKLEILEKKILDKLTKIEEKL